MNYFEARKHDAFLRRFREDVELFWARDPKAPGERALREVFREASDRVRELGYQPSWVRTATLARNPRDLSGNYIGDLLSNEQWRRARALGFLDECVGAAKFARRRARNRLLSPWCWPVDLVALVVSFPVRVLRAAGMPKSHESEWWVRLIQAAFTIFTIGLATAFGWQAAP